MTAVHHTLTPADEATMAGTRAYLASMPRMVVAPDSRGYYDEFMNGTPVADGVSFERGSVAGVDGWWVIPEDAAPDVALVHFHGGGYVIGSADAFRGLVSHLAKAAGARTFLPEYALAPESPFPASFDQASAIIRELGGNGQTRLAVSGDSAGGGLALAAVQATGETAVALLLISPWTDMTLTSASLTERADSDPILSREGLEGAASLYAADLDRSDVRISPRSGAFDAVPPTMVHVGSDEILLDDSLALGDAAGSRVDVHVWEGMTHVFPASLANLEAGREAIALSGAFIRSQLAR